MVENQKPSPRPGGVHSNTRNRLSWKEELNRSFTDLDSLLGFLNLDASQSPKLLYEDYRFPLLVTRSFSERMNKGDWSDPLLLQILPLKQEQDIASGFVTDPVGDTDFTAAPGLIHKYPGRALLIPCPLCSMHCRYCFRREYPYAQLPKTTAEWLPSFDYLKNHNEVSEVILSGGEPLLLDNQQLQDFFSKLVEISHISTIRIHTRIPVSLPARIDTGLIDLLIHSKQNGKHVVIIIQANHAQELEGDCLEALEKLHLAGILVFNQTVLLKKINDTIEAQIQLLNKLIRHEVIPCYLHQLDKTAGTHHFEVPEKEGKNLYKGIKHNVPGYAVPKYVKEIKGEKAKISIA
jgi:EF-P beta-lysylation protein EpmB